MATLTFTVDSALLRELGEKLVETVHLALVELVKNAYDADSTYVSIVFEKNDLGEDEIHIEDDGVGMNFDTVNKYWMRIATTNKKENPFSPIYGRPKTGAKGIGRFSCRRLGTKLYLTTIGHNDGKTKKGNYNFQRTEVTFPWLDFVPGTDVTKIECPGNQYKVTNVKTGTTLVIGGINKSDWTIRGLNWLKRQLAVLASNRGACREGYAEDPGFKVYLIAPDLKGGISDIRDDLIKGGWGTLTAEIDKDKHAHCVLKAKGIGKKVITSQRVFKNLNDIKLSIGIIPQVKLV